MQEHPSQKSEFNTGIVYIHIVKGVIVIKQYCVKSNIYLKKNIGINRVLIPKLNKIDFF